MGIAIHPSAHYAVVATASPTWHFVDIPRQVCLKKVTTNEADTIYQSCALHPDGLILGTGTKQGVLKIWDIREQKNVSSLTEHSNAIEDIAFSENGYLLATGSSDGTVKIWDLRKLACTKTSDIGASVGSLAFDYSGVYLGIASNTKAQVKVVKEWQDAVVSSFCFLCLLSHLIVILFFVSRYWMVFIIRILQVLLGDHMLEL